MSEEVKEQAISAAKSLAEAMDYIGVMAVEMFVCNGSVSLNEIAPRPHNSGHFTMDACNYSQFDQQVRTLAGLPVAKISQHQPAVMYNVLGDLILREDFQWQSLQQLNNSHLHIYGKTEARAGRKMAHVNLLGSEVESLLSTIQSVVA